MKWDGNDRTQKRGDGNADDPPTNSELYDGQQVEEIYGVIQKDGNDSRRTNQAPSSNR